MNGFDTVEMSAVSADELAEIDGGFIVALVGLAGGAAIVGGIALIAKEALKGKTGTLNALNIGGSR
jgi:hypothetical protein